MDPLSKMQAYMGDKIWAINNTSCTSAARSAGKRGGVAKMNKKKPEGEPKSVVISARVSKEDVLELDKIARKYGVKRSDLVKGYLRNEV